MPELTAETEMNGSICAVKGIELKPIRLRKSLYLLIPMEIAKLIGVTEKTMFLLTLKQDNGCILMYNTLEPQHDSGREDN